MSPSDNTSGIEPIIPRWEWRIFAENPSELQNYFKSLAPLRREKTDQVYFLVPQPDLNLKFRYDQFDLKQLVEINSQGFQKWTPIYKSPIPLGDRDVDKLLGILGMVPQRSHQAGEYIDPVDIFLGNPDIVKVQVEKYREKYRIDGVSCEYAAIKNDTLKLVTIAIEDADPLNISHVKAKLHIKTEENVSYPAALKQSLNYKPAR
ncbi:MAG: hypothetical protein K9M49_07700 [Candidatus Marinimicrobia bacterium]|nr:hypothetical protein [Candidatus Neomarinimicrobiota bacterium]MCF7850960.1 hypothetical protein [Candidatus Neomarinimicrobiota bacterium]MCF7905024.1 hypothetical protein [Candidatus Neomarinimicrobiota bacterium]